MRIFLLSLFFCFTMPVQAYSGFSDALRSQYQRKIECQLCHTAGQTYTPFGQDFARLYQGPAGLIRTLKALGELDSDGDGLTNHEELKTGSDPSLPLLNKNPPHSR